MKSNKNIGSVPGECWNLQSSNSETIPPVVIIIPQGDECYGIPLFEEDWQATGKHVKINPVPDFLHNGISQLDNAWCACDLYDKIDTSKLYKKIGTVDWAIVHELKKELGQTEGECKLPRGIMMLPGVGDEREIFHKQLSFSFRKHVNETFVEKLKNKLLSFAQEANFDQYIVPRMSFVRSESEDVTVRDIATIKCYDKNFSLTIAFKNIASVKLEQDDASFCLSKLNDKFITLGKLPLIKDSLVRITLIDNTEITIKLRDIDFEENKD